MLGFLVSMSGWGFGHVCWLCLLVEHAGSAVYVEGRRVGRRVWNLGGSAGLSGFLLSVWVLDGV